MYHNLIMRHAQYNSRFICVHDDVHDHVFTAIHAVSEIDYNVHILDHSQRMLYIFIPIARWLLWIIEYKLLFQTRQGF